MKERMLVWLDREYLLSLMRLLEEKVRTEAEGHFAEGGAFTPLYMALDEACHNNANED